MTLAASTSASSVFADELNERERSRGKEGENPRKWKNEAEDGERAARQKIILSRSFRTRGSKGEVIAFLPGCEDDDHRNVETTKRVPGDLFGPLGKTGRDRGSRMRVQVRNQR